MGRPEPALSGNDKVDPTRCSSIGPNAMYCRTLSVCSASLGAVVWLDFCTAWP